MCRPFICTQMSSSTSVHIKMPLHKQHGGITLWHECNGACATDVRQLCDNLSLIQRFIEYSKTEFSSNGERDTDKHSCDVPNGPATTTATTLYALLFHGTCGTIKQFSLIKTSYKTP
jgi:hypothetical protein